MSPLARRRWLAWGMASALAPRAAAAGEREPAADPVRRGRPLVFGRDHGAHPSVRTEWWYVTGWLGPPEAPTHGFQVTFFRSRTGLAQGMPGRLAPRHLLFAHAAVTELATRRHLHAQRIARWNGEPREQAAAGASITDTDVWIGRWRLKRSADGLAGEVDADAPTGWSLGLGLRPTQPLLLQGDAGFSRKGPEERQASHYYSQPQLAAEARLWLDGRRTEGRGRAWLDHEWSDEILAPAAVGWDWIGINLLDGGALTAFALRRADGSALWTGGSHRDASGAQRVFVDGEQRWSALRRWRSPATGANYPVQWRVDTPVGSFTVNALLDSQELDGRGATGTVYWEGLSELLDAAGRRVGLGYLEMTGYAGTLRL